MNGPEDQENGEQLDSLVPALRPKTLSRRAIPLEAAWRVSPGTPLAHHQFAHFWGVIRDHKLLISAAFLLPIGIAVTVAAMQPSVYRATTSLELLGVNQNFLNLKEIDPTTPLSSNSDRGDSYTQTQLELLKRDVLVERVVRKLHLVQNPDFASSKGILSYLPLHQPQHAPDRAERVHSAVLASQKKLKVQQLRQSNLVEVSFQDSDPKLCMDFVNTLANEAVDENMRSRLELGRSVGAWLEQHLAGLREKLDAAEHELQAYSAEAGLPPTSDKSAGEDARLTRLEDQLGKAQTDRIHRESKYEIALSANLDTLPEVLDDPALKEYHVRLSELRRQQAELSASLTPDHPKVQRVQAQIADMQATIAEARTNILNRLHNEYFAAQREEQADGAAFAKQASKASTAAQKEIHYNTLKRELETTRSMYEDVLKRVNDTKLVSVTRPSGMRIIDAATAAVKEDMWRTRIFIGGIGVLTGFLFAGLLAFVVDQATDTIKAPGHIPALLNVPELGIIPTMAKPRRNPAAIAPALPLSALGSIHSVITSMLFALEADPNKRFITVSSPGPGEGKTTVTSNLGVMLSEVGHRVLLIDADIRRPSLHTMFGIQNKIGLTDILSDSEPISISEIKASMERVLTSDSGSLDVLTAGERAIGRFGLLHARRTAELLESLRNDYDLILLDTPPLLLVPESRFIGRMTDWCVLVFRAGKTTMDAALDAQRQTAEDGIPLLGTILNDCNSRQPAYRYYGDYYSAGRLNG
jgi:capsular exopolysaccharide synthesis family protein